MMDGLIDTPCAATVVPTPAAPMPTGAMLTSSLVSETPVTVNLFFFFFLNW